LSQRRTPSCEGGWDGWDCPSSDDSGGGQLGGGQLGGDAITPIVE